MLTNIFGSLFFLSIIVFIISVVLVIVTFFKGKKLGKLKYISIFSLSVIVISFFVVIKVILSYNVYRK